MTLKDKILQQLSAEIGECLSGQKLSDRFGVSRTAIWKAINLLKKQGHEIDSVPSKGYCLSQLSQLPTETSIKNAFKNQEKYDISIFDTSTSTNEVIKKLAQKGAKEGKVILSHQQTSGKGRQNRSFFSPKGDGLYFSILLRPKLPLFDASLITVLAASAVTEVLEQITGTNIQIKWVNDLLIGDKKFAGILTEGSVNIEDGRFDYIVLGVGINLTTPIDGYPEYLKSKTTSLFGVEKCDIIQKSHIIANIIENIFFYYENIKDKSFMEIYKNKQYLVSKEIDIYQNDIKIDSGIVLGVDDDGHLLVDNGKIFCLSSGEARVKVKKNK